jgi:hypothetical protein
MKKLITPIAITAADSNSRTITGRIVTFEETGNASIGKVQFAKQIQLKQCQFCLTLNMIARVALAKHFQLNQRSRH